MHTAGRRGLQHLCLQLLALQAITSLCVASCAVLSDNHAHTSDWTRFEGHGVMTALHTSVKQQVSMNTALQMQLFTPLQQLHV